MTELNELFPDPVERELGGLKVVIKPITIGQIPKITRLVKGIDIAGKRWDEPQFWVDLISDHGDSVIEMVALACKQKAEDVTELPFDDFVLLAIEVIRVNADFFTRRVMPSLQTAMAQVGSMASSGSSSTGTDSATSAATH